MYPIFPTQSGQGSIILLLLRQCLASSSSTIVRTQVQVRFLALLNNMLYQHFHSLLLEQHPESIAKHRSSQCTYGIPAAKRRGQKNPLQSLSQSAPG
jgi:hypothetical protein